MAEISDEIRERAALILQFAAQYVVSPYNASRELFGEHSSDALELAMDAWRAVTCADSEQLELGEAESLLRDGWCPGDEVKHV